MWRPDRQIDVAGISITPEAHVPNSNNEMHHGETVPVEDAYWQPHALHPETLMLNYGYDPQLSEGAVKPPVFLTSTFVFKTAEDGQDFFDFVSGRREPPEGHGCGLGLFAIQPSQ